MFRMEQTADAADGSRVVRQRAYMSDGKVLKRTLIYRPGEARTEISWTVGGEYKRAAADTVIAKRMALGWRMI